MNPQKMSNNLQALNGKE